MTVRASRRGVLRALGTGALGAAVVGTGNVAGKPKSDGIETLFSYTPPKLPENIAIDRRGNKYVSFPPLGEVRKITPDNETESLLATFDTNPDDFGVLGLEVTPTGVVYACLVTTLGPEADPLGVWRIERDGTKSLYAGLPMNSFPNDILPDGDRLLVTDTTLGAVWEVRDGEATPWVADPLLEGLGNIPGFPPLGANGIARLKDGSVVVANTEKALLVRIPVNPDGSAGTPEEYASYPEVLFDGIAVDTRDNVYVATVGGDRILRAAPDRSVEPILADQTVLSNPSDVTFGTSRAEQKELFVTNYSLIREDNPSLLKLDVGVPGAPIHR